jgi:DNA gyrase subunit B
VEVSRDGNVYKQRYERGLTATKLEIIGKTDTTGTKTTFKPDYEIFEELEFDFEMLVSRYRELAFLNKGIYIRLTDERPEEEPVVKDLHYEGGIVSFVEYINKNKEPMEIPPIYMEGSRYDSYVEIAMQYNMGYSENIFSFANNISTNEGGTHLTGFKTAITKVFNDYSRKYGFLKENDKNFLGEDIREGLSAVINVKLADPQFEGQTKTKLGNSEIRTLVENVMNEKLEAFFEENPKTAREIIEKSLLASRAREAARKAREQTRKANIFSNTTLPGKLTDCTSRNLDVTEIYIVEGDSAGGSAKSGRDREYQAILPLWGKMLNVEKSRIDKVYGNEKLMPVVASLGTGMGEEFEIEKLRYGKVIIMADADVDGAHIRMLLLTFFFRYMRPLIETGHVFIAMPPLYRISKKNKGEYYCYNDKDMDRILKENNWTKDDNDLLMQRYKGLGEMDPEQLWMTTMNPVTRTITQVTMEDAISSDQTFTTLMGVDVGQRKEYISEHAKTVVNLDI